jgi:serine phosphatase RsbU (regulator of sigma subunit)
MKRLFFWNRSRDDGGGGGSGTRGADSTLLTGNPTEDEPFLRILLDSIAGVASSMELDHVLGEIVDSSLEVTKAERAILFLGSEPDRLEVRVARDRAGASMGAELQYSRSIVRRCLEEGQGIRSVVQSDQEALSLGQSVFDLKLRAVMCAPLRVKETTVGVIYVDSRAARREFSGRDLALFSALSAQLAISIENARLYADSLEKARLEKDIEIARRIQKHLLPSVPTVPGLEVGLRFSVCAGASGDTYDFVRVDENRLAVLIGDVTGHGVGAALLTHAAQAAIRSYLELVDDLGEVVTRINNRLTRSVEAGSFMSMLLVRVDARERVLHYVNAGHPQLVVVGPEGLRQHGGGGIALGVVEGARYQVQGPVPLSPGDLIVLLTDGVAETMDPEREPFGEERLRELIASSRDLSAEAALQRIEAALDEHARGCPRDDDLTLIAIKVVEP